MYSLHTMEKMRIGFAGGGTGGHVFPVQSLIKYITKKYPGQHELFWFGEKPSLEHNVAKKLQTVVSDTASSHSSTLHFFPIYSGKRRREKEFKPMVKNILGIFKLLAGIFQSLYYLVRYRIQTVFCKGGYVSLPVVIAAWILRRPVLLHESDTKAGLANRICSKFAKTIFTGFPNVFPHKEVVVGQILDDDLVQGASEKQLSSKQINAGYTNVLVMGGSQGSTSLYEAVLYTLDKDETLYDTMHFYVVLGTENQHLMGHFQGFSHVTVYSFVDQHLMGELLAKADLSITRGGTTSLAEQELFGIKKIIVPIPRTHDQYKNALYYKQTHNDILLDQNNPHFKEELYHAIVAHRVYQKQGYDNPLKSIQKAKDTIVAHLLDPRNS